jgi:hypothetical protein
MNKQFDERQVQVRGQVFFHGFLVAMALLLLNAALQGSGIVWASPFNQNILIFVAIVTVVSIESILRSVYFGQHKRPWVIIGLFGSISVMLALSCVADLARGAAFIDGSGLSGKGSFLVFAMMFIAIDVAACIKTIKERRKDKE